MKTFVKDYAISPQASPVFDLYFGGLKPCVFDIETSGLSAYDSRVILTAMLVRTEDGVRITQFLAEDPFEEDRVLTETMEFFRREEIGYLITYNGGGFDIPFTSKRLESLRLPYEMRFFNFDVYKFIRNGTILPDMLDSLSQKSIERYLSLSSDREDIISGRESVRLFYEYSVSGDQSLEKLILTHNREDVLQLMKILMLLGENDFRPVLAGDDFHEAIAHIGFPVANGSLSARPRICRSSLGITGRQLSSPFNAVYFSSSAADVKAEFSSRTSSFSVEIPLIRRSGSLYIDMHDLDISPSVIESYNLHELPGYVDDYLIFVEEKEKKHREINSFSRLLSELIYDRLLNTAEQ